MGTTDNHKHGDMDISVHEKTFAGFLRIATNFAIAMVVFLILLAMFNG
jgi:hypothetical protein